MQERIEWYHGREAFLSSWQLCSWSSNSSPGMKYDCCLPCSQETNRQPYPETNKSCLHAHTVFLKTHLRTVSVVFFQVICRFGRLFPGKPKTNISIRQHRQIAAANGIWMHTWIGVIASTTAGKKYSKGRTNIKYSIKLHLHYMKESFFDVLNV